MKLILLSVIFCQESISKFTDVMRTACFFFFRCHSTSYIVTGLETGCQYEFRVRAQNMHGLSEPSKPSQPVTTANQTKQAEEEPEPEGKTGIICLKLCDTEYDTEYLHRLFLRWCTQSFQCCNIHLLFPDYEKAFAPLNVEIEPGNMFDEQYTLHEEVGKGRFGIVYRVTEKTSGTRRAAKIIKCIKAKDKEKVDESRPYLHCIICVYTVRELQHNINFQSTKKP